MESWSNLIYISLFAKNVENFKKLYYWPFVILLWRTLCSVYYPIYWLAALFGWCLIFQGLYMLFLHSPVWSPASNGFTSFSSLSLIHNADSFLCLASLLILCNLITLKNIPEYRAQAKLSVPLLKNNFLLFYLVFIERKNRILSSDGINFLFGFHILSVEVQILLKAGRCMQIPW